MCTIKNKQVQEERINDIIRIINIMMNTRRSDQIASENVIDKFEQVMMMPDYNYLTVYEMSQVYNHFYQINPKCFE